MTKKERIDITKTWHQVAPLKKSRAAAIADLEHCIKNEQDRKDYRVVQSKRFRSRWEIQYGKRW